MGDNKITYLTFNPHELFEVFAYVLVTEENF